MSIRINFLQWQICSWQEFLKDKPGSVLSQKQIKEQAWRGSSWWHCVWRLTSSLFWEHPALRAPGSLLLLQVPVCCREKVQLFAAINSINKLIRGLGNKFLLWLLHTAWVTGLTVQLWIVVQRKQNWTTEQVTAKPCLSLPIAFLQVILLFDLVFPSHWNTPAELARGEDLSVLYMLLRHQFVWFFNLFAFYTNTSTLCPSLFVRGFFLQHLDYISISESCLSAGFCYHSVFATCFCCDSFPHYHSMWLLLPLWHQDLSTVFPDECLNDK